MVREAEVNGKEVVIGEENVVGEQVRLKRKKMHLEID